MQKDQINLFPKLCICKQNEGTDHRFGLTEQGKSSNCRTIVKSRIQAFYPIPETSAKVLSITLQWRGTQWWVPQKQPKHYSKNLSPSTTLVTSTTSRLALAVLSNITSLTTGKPPCPQQTQTSARAVLLRSLGKHQEFPKLPPHCCSSTVQQPRCWNGQPRVSCMSTRPKKPAVVAHCVTQAEGLGHPLHLSRGRANSRSRLSTFQSSNSWNCLLPRR